MPLELIGDELPFPPRSSDLREEVLAMVTEIKTEPGQWWLVESYPDDPSKAHRRREAIRKHAPTEVEVTVRMPNVYARWAPAATDEEANAS